MEWIKVASSNIDSYNYDEESEEFQVKFNSGHVYKYEGVPKSVVDDFERASSKGSFLNSNIKKFTYDRLS